MGFEEINNGEEISWEEFKSSAEHDIEDVKDKKTKHAIKLNTVNGYIGVILQKIIN